MMKVPEIHNLAQIDKRKCQEETDLALHFDYHGHEPINVLKYYSHKTRENLGIRSISNSLTIN